MTNQLERLIKEIEKEILSWEYNMNVWPDAIADKIRAAMPGILEEAYRAGYNTFGISEEEGLARYLNQDKGE